MKIRKVVIPAAGLGTRFLPATKAQPKEMLPIVDKPTIQYIVEEAVASGIESVVIITGRSKRAIEDHFDKSIELELELTKKNKCELLQLVEDIASMVNVMYVRQKEPLGLGHAILTAKDFIGNEPFGVILGDDVVKGDKPALGQLMDAYGKCGSTVLGVQRVDIKDTDKYGVIATDEPDGRLHKVSDLVEKPGPENAPSDIAILGRYVLTPGIFEAIENTPPGKGGEIQLTDAIRRLQETEAVYAYEFEGKRYDVGDKLGFLKATCEFALDRDDLREDFARYLKQLAGEIK
ncbi:UTP--glucose-1-phosphate uridylyltransferase GalU [Christensenella intestinihominis]|uniref:UTP--glucose-1-phosphate uridylyltransferase GalU n=1 Tax=Christensenella intestinihominis TaxID=1851429 RepID=UPI00082C9AF8|nr:UTP--glucose-1-phosphate uridylyltransferase GalU [Christensenella intestinihominis]